MKPIDPKDYIDAVPVPKQVELVTIGYVRSPYRERFGTPRQATVGDPGGGDTVQDGILEIDPDVVPAKALKDLAGFDYVWVIAWLHLNRHWRPQVKPPRGPREARGVLATRAPHRPNPIGLSACQVLGVEGNKVHVRGLDLLDETPILDIKPYVPYADAFPFASAGWVDAIDGRDPSEGPGRRLVGDRGEQ